MNYLSEKEIKEKSVEILVAFSEYCEENDLKYSLAFGTLLGAVRHRGFIPWDDDIDIGMPREDYERFIKLSKSKPIGMKYDVLHYDTCPNYLLPFTKITDNTTMGYEWARGKGIQNGVWIDIFPFDYVPENEVERLNFIQKINKEKVKIVIRSLPFKFNKSPIVFLKNVVKYIVFLCTSNKSLLKRIKRFDELTFSIDKSKTTKMTIINSLDVGDGENGVIEYNDFFGNMIKLEFENREFYAPKEYDKWLTQNYGDYMQLPPESQRVSHNSVIWYK